MADFFADLVGGVVEAMLRGQVQKAVSGFVQKGYITPAQEPIMVEGVMLEIQVGLDVYKAGQKPPGS